MKELKEKHTYLITNLSDYERCFEGLQAIIVKKVTNKAIEIYFKKTGEYRWFDKEDKNVKIEIFEDITHFN